jgi:hypothetical protein
MDSQTKSAIKSLVLDPRHTLVACQLASYPVVEYNLLKQITLCY